MGVRLSSEPVTQDGIGGHDGEAAEAEGEKDEIEHGCLRYGAPCRDGA